MSGLSKDTIQILLCRIAEGDETAFKQLFKAYYDELGEFILRLTGLRALAQEIVQDTFLKIWLNRRTLAGVHCFRAYLFNVYYGLAFPALQLLRSSSRAIEKHHLPCC